MRAHGLLARALLMAVVAIGAGRARALDPWTWQDTAWEVGFAALVTLDVAQTRSALDRGMHELNPVLGPHPSDQKLAVAGTAVVVAHATIAVLLPTDYRRIWQVVAVGLEATAVTINAVHIGVRIPF